MTTTLPPFPVDDTTLSLLEAAVDPWAHGDRTASRSSLHDLLRVLSELAGSDLEAVEEVIQDGIEEIPVTRDPVYYEGCVIKALIAEIRCQRKHIAGLERWRKAVLDLCDQAEADCPHTALGRDKNADCRCKPLSPRQIRALPMEEGPERPVIDKLWRQDWDGAEDNVYNLPRTAKPGRKVVMHTKPVERRIPHIDLGDDEEREPDLPTQPASDIPVDAALGEGDSVGA